MEKKTVKIPWKEFVSYAMRVLDSGFPGAAEPKFMRVRGYDPDSECYETPDYVEVEIP